MKLIIIIAIIVSLVNENVNIESYKEVYISKTTEKSWKKAANRCKEFGMNILILKTISERFKLLSIHDSYQYGSEWIAITDMERNCPPSKYTNKKSLFFNCEFLGFCYPYSFSSQSDIVCQTGKKYLCEKIVNTKKLEYIKLTTLEMESTTEKQITKTINCNQTIHNDATYDIICDENVKLNVDIHKQPIAYDEPMPIQFFIIVFVCIFAILIIITCCRRKCFKVYNNTDTTIILTDKCDTF